MKSLYSPQSLLGYEVKLPVKKINFLQLQNFVYTLP